MKVLNVNELLEVANDHLGAEEYGIYAEMAAALSMSLATRLSGLANVTVHDVSDQPGFSGLCATFWSDEEEGNAVFDAIAKADEFGDWD